MSASSKEIPPVRDLVDRLRDTPCDRQPFTPDHSKCKCRLANEAADEIESLRQSMCGAPLLVGQIVMAAGGEVRIPIAQMQSVDKITVTRTDEVSTGDAVFRAAAEARR